RCYDRPADGTWFLYVPRLQTCPLPLSSRVDSFEPPHRRVFLLRGRFARCRECLQPPRSETIGSDERTAISSASTNDHPVSNRRIQTRTCVIVGLRHVSSSTGG